MDHSCRAPRRAGRVALAGLALLAAGCGHAVRPAVPYQHQGVFDFRRPPCQPASRAAEPQADAVTVRYLGAGGLFVGWRGEGLLFGPFFSNPGFLRLALGRMDWDRQAIAQGLAGVPLEQVGALLVGHSHYDHVGDLPVIATEGAAGARILVNRSGANALQAYPDLHARITVLEDIEGGWLRLEDAAGRSLPFRIRAVASDHAPHAGLVRLWKGETPPESLSWDRRRYGNLKEGRSFAFVIDLLEPSNAAAGAEGPAVDAAVHFRIYYQDSAAPDGLGLPPEPAAGDPPYDLAVLCAASAHLVRPAPAALLERIAPGHVLVTHYENFFQPWGPGRGFAPLLTRPRMESFLRRVEAGLGYDGGSGGPVGEVCGPSTRAWTIPLVGEWLVLRASQRRRPQPRGDER